MRTVTFDSTAKPDDPPVWRAVGAGWDAAFTSVSAREAHRVEICRVLVTCLEDNTASARIIAANGGELENVIEDPSRGDRFAATGSRW